MKLDWGSRSALDWRSQRRRSRRASWLRRARLANTEQEQEQEQEREQEQEQEQCTQLRPKKKRGSAEELKEKDER